MIHPNGGSQQETSTLTEETDKRTSSEEESGSDSGSESDSDLHSGSESRSESPSESDITLPCLRRRTCVRVKRIVAPKKTALKEPDSNLPLKEKNIIKKKNVSNTPLSNAKSEKEKQIKND